MPGDSGARDDALDAEARDVLQATFAADRARVADVLEADLAAAGWYDTTAARYRPPTTPVRAAWPAHRPTVVATRGVWLATYNPGGDWYDPATGISHSDVDDENNFPWAQPERAVADGNFWLSTEATPLNRPAIERIGVGDLVVVQRSNPPAKHRHLRGKAGATDVLYGIALAVSAESWQRASTGVWERRVNLMPAAKFTWPIPRRTALRHNRLRLHSLNRRPQLPDGTGGIGFTLSAVMPPDIPELLGVCGIHPAALREPNLAVLAARLRATATGNRELWNYRYNHVVINAVRVAHEQEAVRRCRAWARRRGWMEHENAQRTGNAGYDLLFADRVTGVFIQVEVKGYMSRDLATVHLQRSQARRAREAAQGTPPDWMLYAVLGVHGKRPTVRRHTAAEIVALLDSGRIQVRG